MNQTYKIVKLTNGEDIICELEEKSKSVYEIQNPLQIITTREVQNGGVQEGLSLGRWCHPFTDQTYFSIPVDAVVTTAKASPGLSKYYEYILKKCINCNFIYQEFVLDNLSTKYFYENIEKKHPGNLKKFVYENKNLKFADIIKKNYAK